MITLGMNQMKHVLRPFLLQIMVGSDAKLLPTLFNVDWTNVTVVKPM